MCPLGAGQRRPSRSPRSQRSRSKDVDCLKKYTERLVEERRLTETSDPNQLHSSKWIPLSKHVNQLRSSSQNHSGVPIRNDGRDLDVGRVRIDSTRWLPVINRKVCPENIRRSSHAQIEGAIYVQLPAGRSLSNESNFSRIDSYHRDRRNTEFGYCGKESVDPPRWLQSEISSSRYIPSPLDRKYSEGSSSKPMPNRWMTFTRYPSPCPIVRRNTERRPCTSERSEINWSGRSKENIKSFTVTDNRAFQVPNIDCARLRQRIRELYDIKTETEFPKRLNHALSKDAWISKSNSDEEKYPTSSGTRNSQKLEFTDRFSKFSQFEDKPEVKSKKSTDSSFDDDWEERLRKFHERLRFSEDLGIDQKIRARDRRTSSDDYVGFSRKQSHEENFGKDIKRNSDASSRSRVSYAEIDFSDLSKRGSRTSDASYVSITTLSPKNGSIESRNVSISTYSGKSKSFESQNVPRAEIISQRFVSQSVDGRPNTPVPPKEMDDLLHTEKPFNQRGRIKYKI